MEVWITNIHPKVKLRLEKLRSLALKALPQMDKGRLHIVLTDDSYITNLNRRFTGRTGPTDVLSFPFPAQRLPTEEMVWGEIYISLDRAAEQARDYGIGLEDETRRLIIHGILHLLGYDHETNKEAKQMKEKEDQLLSGEPR